MASSLRIPGQPFLALRPSKGVQQFFPAAARQCRYRYFSQTPRQNSRMGMAQQIPMKQPAQPTMRSQIRNRPRSEMPQDLGLFQGSFISPVWSEMPSIFEQPKERLHMEWIWLKMAFQNYAGVLMYCKYIFSGMKIMHWGRRKIAADLHKQMYTAFANGDILSLNKICCPGLANDLAGRINRRRRGEKVTWSLDKYIRGPSTFFTGVRVVSDRASKLPHLADSGARQIVVRITSRQTKGRITSTDSKDSTAPQETQQDCTEYIVIQQLRWSGENGPWRIWGHTSPTTVEELDSPAFAQGLTAAERYQAMMHAVGRK